MPSPRSLVLVAAATCFACGGQPPPPVKPPPPIASAPPPTPPPVRARWVFSHPERGLTAKLDLGDGTTIYAGENGRRELAKGDAPMVDAPVLALGNLVGVLRDDKKQLVFVAEDGDAYVASEPLGSLDTVRQGPLTDPKPSANKLVTPTTGKVAILGIAPTDRKLLRTADYGATWKPVDYAGAAKPYGRAMSVALDAKGNGLLLHLPQRLFVTHDDGATWTPIASPGIGARRVMRDGGGRVFLEGYGGQRAKLDGQNLAITTETPEPMYKPSVVAPGAPASTSPNVRTERRTLLTGDRVVELTQIERKGKAREIEILSTKLGEKPSEKDKPALSTELVGASGLSQHIAGWGSELIYLRDDDDADAESSTTTLFRSKDHGATWTKESTLQGAEPSQSEGVTVALGPKGWSFVTSLCPREHDDDAPSGGDCSRRQIRPAGGAAFEDMAFVEEFTPESFAFDEAHDRVYVVGTHDSDKYVYESPLSQNKFTRTKLLADVSSDSNVTITVDAKGTLRALAHDTSKRQWTLHRRGADGKELPKLYVPAHRGDASFVGARGLIFTGHGGGWETNDGGETWIRVATNGFVRDFACTEAGCVNGDAQRVGWDLPAVQSQDKMIAQAEPVKQTKQDPPPPVSPPGPSMELTCKPTGTATPLSFVPGTELLDGRSPEMRWASIKNEADGRMSVVVGTKTTVKTLPLLAAEPKPAAAAPGAKVPAMEHRQGQRTLPDGVVTARYGFAPASGGPYNPVDVDLTWWSSGTGKTQHKILPKVKPFRVSRYGFSGSPQIVEGGLLFQPARGEPAFFVHDDGKLETLSTPANASIENAEHVGKRWLVTDWDGWTARTSVSDDNGTTWKQKAWGLDEGGSVTLTSIGGKATLNLTHSGSPTLLFGLDQTLPDDPPAPIVVQASTTDALCDAQSGRQRFVAYLPYERRTVKARIEETNKTVTPLSATTRVTHDMPNGKTCTSAYALSGAQTAFIYPEAKGWSGWRFRRNTDPKEKQATWLAEPLTCQ